MESNIAPNPYNITEWNNQYSRTVLIADMKISRNPRESLITYGLGSCVAVMLYDPIRRVGGMLHYLLPVADDKGLKANPMRYGDSGIIGLYRSVIRAGGEHCRLIVKAVGGSTINQPDNEKSIGRQNCVIYYEMLKELRLNSGLNDLGGFCSRTAILKIEDGQVLVRSKGVLSTL